MAKILVIDDNEDLRETIVSVLEDEGYATLIAPDGASGVRVFGESRPDLVITDLIMPKSNGLDTIREIKTIDPGARIVAMSGGSLISHEYYLDVASSLGAMHVLPKPFEIDELVRVVAKCLNSPPPAPGSMIA
jgi:DNA-binding response OmpR family regulator